MLFITVTTSCFSDFSAATQPLQLCDATRPLAFKPPHWTVATASVRSSQQRRAMPELLNYAGAPLPETFPFWELLLHGPHRTVSLRNPFTTMKPKGFKHLRLINNSCLQPSHQAAGTLSFACELQHKPRPFAQWSHSKTLSTGAREMVQWLTALPAPPENPSPVLSTHIGGSHLPQL